MTNATLNWDLVDQEAERLGVGREARKKWKQRATGVPHAWRIRIVERLGEGGVNVAFSDFDQLATPEQAKAA